MPPINQGSRAALITWTVIASILFVVSTVLAFFANSENTALQAKLDAQIAKTDPVVSEGDLTGPVFNELTTAKSDPANKYNASDTLMKVAGAQRAELAGRISPGAGSNSIVLTAATNAVAGITRELPEVKVTPTATLTEVIGTLVSEIKKRDAEVVTANAGKVDAETRLTALQTDTTAQLAAKDEEIAAATAATTAATTAAAADRTATDAKVVAIQATVDELKKIFDASATESQSINVSQAATIKALTAQIAQLNLKLKDLRLPVDTVARQADGRIVKSPGNSVVYIDLGSGDQVVPGMSFEVYDRLEGLPVATASSATADTYAKGKASIEIVRVQPGSAECRIVRLTPGQSVVEGDLISNLVYDRNTKYQFFVYGAFDLDRNGNSTATDTDVIKRLVTQWGGSVSDKLDASTDFLVLGTVPVVPNYTDEELENPINVDSKQKAEQALKDYEDLTVKAVQYNIPILNQNRFLYFSGYFQQSAQ